ncbi:MAG: hypothetical protein BWY76_02882 [bacterium ADurb.Bin429]|nr:MAG: hypothetical protein BWY76_02882 [bacterium ADurb.Bin429]
MNNLNAFSQHFADILFRAFPEWRKYARYDDTEGVAAGTIHIIVPHPEDTEKRLDIWTVNDEVTVGWYGWHTHFNNWSGISDEDAYQQAMSMIRDLIDDEFILAVCFDHDGTVGRAWEYSVGDDFAEAYTYQKKHADKQVCLRSWRGSHDRCLKA